MYVYQEISAPESRTDKHLDQWYASTDILVNIQHVVPRVTVTVVDDSDQTPMVPHRRRSRDTQTQDFLLAPSAFSGLWSEASLLMYRQMVVGTMINTVQWGIACQYAEHNTVNGSIFKNERDCQDKQLNKFCCPNF